MKADATLAADRGEFFDWLNRSGFIVCVHHGDKNRVRAQGGLEIFGIDAAEAINWQQRKFETLMVLEMLESMEDGMVLRGRGDQMAAARGVSSGNAQNSKVARFGSAARENYFVGFDPKKVGESFSRAINRRPRLPAGCVNARRIAEVVAQERHHCGKRLRSERSRGVVI